MSYGRRMGTRRVWPLVLALLGGCITQSGGDDGGYGGDYGGWGSGVGGVGGGGGYGCHQDADCGTDVCARDGECVLASEVRIVHVLWTVHDAAASATSCTNAPHLDITFYDGNADSFGFSPVPCVEGKFTVDKLPTWYTSVGLERAGDYNGGATAAFDATGNASLDLPY
jgi:hypothetical protein